MTDPVAIGDVVADKYVVQGVLGRGGIGVVFAAEHVRLRRRVALKFLRSELAHLPEVVQRFLREGRAAAQLESEHVARIMDADTTPGGAPYIVMELLEGRDLKTVLKDEGALPVETAVDYVMQACEAVAEAHAIGILHRDLKSDNLFVTRNPLGLPLVKVLDFGLSKIETKEPEAGLTSDNHVMGSPQFMSPEQMRSSRDVDARSDLWALGVVLYTLLAGRVPFEGKYLTEVCSAVLSGDMPSLASLRPDVPPGLAQAIARCMRLERDERFQSASELAAALAPFGGPGGAARAARIARVVAERRGEPKGPDSTSAPVVANAPAPAVEASEPLVAPARRSPRAVGRRRIWLASLTLMSGLVLLATAVFFRHRSVAPLPPPPLPAAVVANAAPPADAPVDTGAAPPEPPPTAAPASVVSHPASTGARASGKPAPAAPHPRARPRRTQSDEDVILKLPH